MARQRTGSSRVARRGLLTVIMAGLAATSLMTPIAYLAPAFQLQQLDFAAMLGSLVTNQVAPSVSTPWLLGMLLHFVNGSLIFPVVYALVVYPRLGGPPWLRGVAYGVALWALVQIVVMPLAGLGMFSSATSRPGAALAWSFGTHVLYGAALGALATRRVARVLERRGRDAARRAA